jgi:hypothetical protein
MSIDEWIDLNGFRKFQQDIVIHIQCATLCSEEDAESAARRVMISLRQEMELRNENSRH